MRSLKEEEMSKYIKILGIAVFFILALFSSGFAEEESFTITTYYPSPYGVYNELQLYPHSPPTSPCDDAHKGTMYYTGTGAEVYICDGYNWQPLGGGGGGGKVVIGDVEIIAVSGNCPSGYTRIAGKWQSQSREVTTDWPNRVRCSCTSPSGWQTGADVPHCTFGICYDRDEGRNYCCDNRKCYSTIIKSVCIGDVQ